MAKKENKGGLLRNDQIEQDNTVRGKTEGGYEGAQDTGDKDLQPRETPTQKRDEQAARSEDEEE